MFELNTFDSIQIGLASPEKIREWSHGEVKKPETINYRTLKPEKDGLFCERIFGPTKDWECHCGRYKRIRYKGIVCEKCGVEVTRAKVRRERMGHIELAAPVSHIWYFKGIPSRMGLLLDMSPRSLEKVLYFAAFVVTEPGETPLEYKQLLTDKEYREAQAKFGEDSFSAGMGAEAVKVLLKKVDLEEEAKALREELKTSTGQKRIRAIKRLEVVEAFRQSGNKPEWIIMDVVPVIPPELRPMVQLDGGRFATSDLNDLYRRVINRNNRLNRLLQLRAPDIIVRNEKRMLQEAVDALIDNGRRGRPVTGPGNRPLKSLSDMLRGKQGRFRQNLLGKRVDYSGRSVIVVGPELKMYQCGLPKEMALELFKPFVMKKLVEEGFAHNIKSAKRMVEKVRPEVWDVLEEVIKGHPVLLNRAPTLHRLGIQAFEPILVEGRAIKLHPLACTAYNADFDGDQMAVHVPLSVEAQSEARFLMLAANNILKPQDGKPVVSPTQDMVIGSYYLTIHRKGAKGEGSIFASPDEAILAYNTGNIDLQAMVKIRVTKEVDGGMKTGIIETTTGRVIFNQAIPQDLGYMDRSIPGNELRFEVDQLIDKKQLGKLVDLCYAKLGPTKTSHVLDNIKKQGFHYSTIGAITVSVSDIKIPPAKKKLIAEAEDRVLTIEKQYKRGLLTDKEKKDNAVKVWEETTGKVTDALMKSLDEFNPIYMMANSGARGSTNQIRQLAGMRGLMADPNGEIIEIPIRANFREGLTVLEYFISSHGARKGLADTALRTADSGYLTRRLVDVSHNVIVREVDCFENLGEQVQGVPIRKLTNTSGKEVIEPLCDRIRGRYTSQDVIDKDGSVIVKANEMITNEIADRIERAGIEEVYIRTVFTCKSEHGVCAKCYGANMATGGPVDIGEAVGVIAAQSIGEPGTQLTMRTFHTGGVAGGDITQGLPRVEELFEARKPRGLAVISEIAGTVAINDTRKKREITVANDSGEAKTYLIPYGSRVTVADGQVIEAGDELTEGSINPNDILKIKGVKGVQEYLLKEVQMVYRMQGVEISDKHLEIIVRQMLKKCKIEDAGDTSMLPGELVDIFQFDKENEQMIEGGKEPATASRVLLGITKASLSTNSFLSAASFQETTRVLTEAAIKGKVDPLLGLKENIIIGKLIPAGTGMKRYKNIDVISNVVNEDIAAQIDDDLSDTEL
ncbi:DNA-directed RNA polymerase subunit beta' [Christensenella minuta]|uniref:DNA-directed RNA polymerase subunit beta' n=1 Tax=Christensenella minuta TaxID=626937 RepID=UPI0007E20DB4|nr:DNA-directed RNA polymerase subunit beta' [Christensenella minuta]AYH40209.1 DNA-directed RNA polymerase subunit beta' [Christensenella minuta]MDY3750849.1 DNA-directed RNA polymerase subunit beta' [Christensenella minuta]OAQ39986.1 DNA-directed RNA polymerase subunit beta' [Christensenella minuta]